jgi:hypothetical protein
VLLDTAISKKNQKKQKIKGFSRGINRLFKFDLM